MRAPARESSVRFWMCHGPESGYVKLTLRPDQQVTFESGGKHDEGYSWEAVTFRYDADAQLVIREDSSQGRDCDGPHSSYQKLVCPVDRLKAGREGFEDPEVTLPDWDRAEAWQRDTFAEMAGY